MKSPFNFLLFQIAPLRSLAPPLLSLVRPVGIKPDSFVSFVNFAVQTLLIESAHLIAELLPVVVD